MLRNSCCSGDSGTGEAIFFSSSSDKVSAVDLNSEMKLGIQPMSGLLGDLKNSLVVCFYSSAEVRTDMRSTPS